MSTWYLIGGGPSLRGVDLSWLEGRHVLAVNRAYEVVPWADVLYFTDRRFWDWHGKAVMRLAARKICGVRTGSRPEIEEAGVERWEITRMRGIEMIPRKIRSGNNSGYAAINVAMHLGARTIILLGYDMRYGVDGRSHWHDGYPCGGTDRVFRKMLPYFETLVDPLRKIGIVVLTTYVRDRRETALTCFPLVHIDIVRHFDYLEDSCAASVA